MGATPVQTKMVSGQVSADVIITRDAGAFKGSCIPAMSAEAYLKLHNVYYEEAPFLGDAD